MMGTVRLVVLAAFAIALIGVAAIGLGAPRQTAAGDCHSNTLAGIFFTNVDEGDIDGAVAMLSDDFIFTQIDVREGSFAAVWQAGVRHRRGRRGAAQHLGPHGPRRRRERRYGRRRTRTDHSVAAGCRPHFAAVHDHGCRRKDRARTFTFDPDDVATQQFIDDQAQQDEGDGEDEGDARGA